MSLSDMTISRLSAKKPSGAGRCTTSCFMALVPMDMSPVTPAISLMMRDAGPATLTTTGALIDSPFCNCTPETRPSLLRMAVAFALKRNVEPLASPARCRLCADNAGSVT